MWNEGIFVAYFKAIIDNETYKNLDHMNNICFLANAKGGYTLAFHTVTNRHGLALTQIVMPISP